MEQHLAATPSDYIWWRYGAGEDREAAAKVTRKMTEAELAEREAAIAAGKWEGLCCPGSDFSCRGAVLASCCGAL